MGRRSRGHSLTMPFVIQNKAFSEGLCVLVLYFMGSDFRSIKGIVHSLFTHLLAIPNYSLDSSHSGRQDYKQFNLTIFIKLWVNYIIKLFYVLYLCSV